MKKKVKVVGAVMENEKGEVLCALRSPEMALPNLWEFPGGKIEEGEKPEETLVREIEEELECQIEVGELVADIVHEYPTFIINLITYKAKITNGTPIATEHAELKWVPLKDLRTLEWAPADLPTIDALLA
ncbi:MULTISPECIES: (deoxy)nucleoside triphosphate pyrophosphohydrolase [unclassified Bacillus (in: firmicutes)]|uniref:(deoxy)nucleoside triphosphate pyrophosphohydrolase n=1 Tax=unclassified Bacillus (in: firmicutes) TaxID=185979 RepID=UPI00111E1283|nr:MULTISPECIES: (deoxy)nucleoside triphosphate pyrophosphohydrolase [unclassified Bacillus (in: firmicutes)]